MPSLSLGLKPALVRAAASWRARAARTQTGTEIDMPVSKGGWQAHAVSVCCSRELEWRAGGGGRAQAVESVEAGRRNSSVSKGCPGSTHPVSP